MGLVQALEALGLEGEIAISGRWVKLNGERCSAYVVQTAWNGFFTWCDHPEEREVRSFLDPVEAIQAGLRRAARPGNKARTGRTSKRVKVERHGHRTDRSR